LAYFGLASLVLIDLVLAYLVLAYLGHGNSTVRAHRRHLQTENVVVHRSPQATPAGPAGDAAAEIGTKLSLTCRRQVRFLRRSRTNYRVAAARSSVRFGSLRGDDAIFDGIPATPAASSRVISTVDRKWLGATRSVTPSRGRTDQVTGS
jgi:hypothetical protein